MALTERHANVTRQGLVDAGAALGLRPQISHREMDSIASRMAPALDAIIASIERENARLPGNTRQYHGGELRLLRAGPGLSPRLGG